MLPAQPPARTVRQPQPTALGLLLRHIELPAGFGRRLALTDHHIRRAQLENDLLGRQLLFRNFPNLHRPSILEHQPRPETPR